MNKSQELLNVVSSIAEETKPRKARKNEDDGTGAPPVMEPGAGEPGAAGDETMPMNQAFMEAYEQTMAGVDAMKDALMQMQGHEAYEQTSAALDGMAQAGAALGEAMEADGLHIPGAGDAAGSQGAPGAEQGASGGGNA